MEFTLLPYTPKTRCLVIYRGLTETGKRQLPWQEYSDCTYIYSIYRYRETVFLLSRYNNKAHSCHNQMMMNGPIKTKNDSVCKCFCLNNLHVDCFRISRANTNACFSRLYGASIRLFFIIYKIPARGFNQNTYKSNWKMRLDRRVDDLKHWNLYD